MKRKEKKKSIGKTVGCLVVLIILALFVRAIFWFVAQYQNSLWNGKNNLGISFKGKDYLLIYFNPSQEKFYLVKIPANTLIQDYTLENLWRLERIANQKNPDIKDPLQKFFAVPVFGQYENDTMGFNDFDIKLRDVLNGKTNLTLFDYLNLKNLRYTISRIDLEKSIFHQTKAMRDEKQIIFDESALDNFFRDIFNDLERSKLKYNFQIIKAFGSNTNADFYERMVSNIGWKVSDIDIRDATPKTNECVLQEKMAEEESFIRRAFDCNVKINPQIHYSAKLLLSAKEN